MDIIEVFTHVKDSDSYKVLLLPFILMIIDFCTGVFNAWATGHLKSYKMREGLNKKCGEMVIIIVGLLANWALNVPSYVVYFLDAYVCIMETVSIMENLDKMGVPIPRIFRIALKNAEYKIQNDDNPLKKEGKENDS